MCAVAVLAVGSPLDKPVSKNTAAAVHGRATDFYHLSNHYTNDV